MKAFQFGEYTVIRKKGSVLANDRLYMMQTQWMFTNLTVNLYNAVFPTVFV